MNDSAANLTENVKRAALLQKLGYKSCLVTNHQYLEKTQPPGLPFLIKEVLKLEITFVVEFLLGQFFSLMTFISLEAWPFNDDIWLIIKIEKLTI